MRTMRLRRGLQAGRLRYNYSITVTPEFADS
jgi:hypothetical protein